MSHRRVTQQIIAVNDFGIVRIAQNHGYFVPFEALDAVQGSVIVVKELQAAGLSRVWSSACGDASLADLRKTSNA